MESIYETNLIKVYHVEVHFCMNSLHYSVVYKITLDPASVT